MSRGIPHAIDVSRPEKGPDCLVAVRHRTDPRGAVVHAGICCRLELSAERVADVHGSVLSCDRQPAVGFGVDYPVSWRFSRNGPV